MDFCTHTFVNIVIQATKQKDWLKLAVLFVENPFIIVIVLFIMLAYCTGILIGFPQNAA